MPEIFTRLACIRTAQGKTDEAIELYCQAKGFLAQRIYYNAFFGNLNIMMWLIDDLYKLVEFDEDFFDFYDLYYLLNRPGTVRFAYKNKDYIIETKEDGGTIAVKFDGKWYRDRSEFFSKATIKGKKLTALYEDIYGFEVIS